MGTREVVVVELVVVVIVRDGRVVVGVLRLVSMRLLATGRPGRVVNLVPLVWRTSGFCQSLAECSRFLRFDQPVQTEPDFLLSRGVLGLLACGCCRGIQVWYPWYLVFWLGS